MNDCTLYFSRMREEKKDMNQFSSLDCFGATVLLGITPGFIYFAQTDPHDIVGAALYMVGGFFIGLIVLAISLITRWNKLSCIINCLGYVLTIIYITTMTLFWIKSCEEYQAKKSLKLLEQTQKVK